MNTDSILGQALDWERRGRPDEAEGLYRSVLAKQPGNADALHLLGILCHRRGRTAEAVELLQKAARRRPRDANILNNLGQILKESGRMDEAEKAYRRAVAFNSGFAEAHNNLGVVLAARKRTAEAEACFRRALQADPANGPAAYNLATVLGADGRRAEAISLFRRIVATRPDLADAHNNLGFFLLETGAAGESEAHLRIALDLKPDHADALVNLAKIMIERNNLRDAAEYLRRALAAAPGHFRALAAMGTVLARSGRHAEAIAAYRRSLAVDPSQEEATIGLAVELTAACAWMECEELMAGIDARTKAAIAGQGRLAESPFLNISRSADPELNFRVARLRAADLTSRLLPLRLPPVPPAERSGRGRIVIGYLSADFKNHPVGHLTRPLFELHDRTRFAVRAYSAGPDDGSDYRRDFERLADGFTDITALTDREAADRIRADGVDILVDLGGYTQGNRLGVTALRPAPVSFNHVGFAGTIGESICDYTVVDPVVVPPGNARFYSEKLVVVPPCYLVHDRDPISGQPVTRSEEGLPEDAFVFCSFNEGRKITPGVFVAWMDLLREVPTSVLWLYRGNDAMVENLRREAAARDIDPDRLVFASRRPKPEHLARLSLADLALDTMPFNGGVTTSDALWAGVPVIAARGTSCASLGAASKLTAVGLPELIAENYPAAMALARSLAGDRTALAAIVRRLADSRITAPLFDSQRGVRMLEKGYAEAFRLFLAGDAPRHIVLDEGALGLYGG
ncbi:MAG: tetratricopeptide repeat protein [Alphaproteobacteria bacterium]|nr:tetratricopeptide repeat protein [Alphaproteobacteria bacterium]